MDQNKRKIQRCSIIDIREKESRIQHFIMLFGVQTMYIATGKANSNSNFIMLFGFLK